MAAKKTVRKPQKKVVRKPVSGKADAESGQMRVQRKITVPPGGKLEEPDREWMRDLRGGENIKIERREAPKGTVPKDWSVSIQLPADLTQLVKHVDPLIPATAVADAIRDLEGKLGEIVRLARAEGSTWTKIGDAIGVSKQAAWERFSGED